MGGEDSDPTKQVIAAQDLARSIIEHAEKWQADTIPIDLLSDTLEAFGSCIMSFKTRLDKIDNVANGMITMAKARQTIQVRSNHFYLLSADGTESIDR